MIVEAIDKRTGRIIRAEDAYSGQRLQCPYCGVDVHPVLGVHKNKKTLSYNGIEILTKTFRTTISKSPKF